MSGRSAYYCEMIVKADLVGIHTASSPRSVAPFGGTRGALGANPIAFGMPSSQGPVVLDMGTSAFMGTELALRERLGQLLPEGVAIDSQGRPTCDPTAARFGALLPFGGYKGYGLGFIVQALGVLAGSAMDPDGDDGYLFVVFKPDLLLPLDDFKRDVTLLIDRVKRVPRAPGVDEIRIPGERAFRSRERLRHEGIEVDRLVYDALAALRYSPIGRAAPLYWNANGCGSSSTRDVRSLGAAILSNQSGVHEFAERRVNLIAWLAAILPRPVRSGDLRVGWGFDCPRCG